MRHEENTFPCQPFKKSESSHSLFHGKTLIWNLRQEPERKEMSDSIRENERDIGKQRS